MKKRVIIVLCLFIIIALLFRVLGNRDKYVTITGYAQGGKYSVTLALPSKNTDPEDLKTGIDSILNRVDNSISGYNPNSLLSKFNRGEDFQPDDIFSKLLEIAMFHYTMTGGAVNCGAAELFDLWGFGFKENKFPDDEQVQEALSRSYLNTYTGIAEELPQIPAQDRIKLNFNAIAQGFSSDLVAGYLSSKGVENMLVNVGGEIVYMGNNPQGKAWRIGVDNPIDGNFDEGADLRGAIDCPSKYHAIVTSGNYRKYYIKDGKKYAHTIDPRTGYPVQHDLLSATIFDYNATDADAIATYCMVIGFDEAKEFIENSDIEGYLIGVDRTWHSDGISILDVK